MGTTNPAFPLDIRRSGSAFASLQLRNDIGTQNGIIFADNNNGNDFEIDHVANSRDLQIYNNNLGEYQIYLSSANGSIGMNTSNPAALLDLRGVGSAVLSGTVPVASISGKTSFASLVVDNSGSGDLFTASSSGLNRFVITQAGNVGYRDNVPREN